MAGNVSVIFELNWKTGKLFQLIGFSSLCCLGIWFEVQAFRIISKWVYIAFCNSMIILMRSQWLLLRYLCWCNLFVTKNVQKNITLGRSGWAFGRFWIVSFSSKKINRLSNCKKSQVVVFIFLCEVWDHFLEWKITISDGMVFNPWIL